MISVCVGLVVIEPGSKFVRLVHHTAHECFEHRRQHLFPAAHDQIFIVCLKYLLHNPWAEEVHKVTGRRTPLQHEQVDQAIPQLDLPSSGRVSKPPSHLRSTRPQSLARSTFLQITSRHKRLATEGALRQYALLGYALNWGFHAQRSTTEETDDLLLRYLAKGTMWQKQTC